ncbi:MAG: alpha/beta hydrolase family esterase [Bacteroidia bacterium]
MNFTKVKNKLLFFLMLICFSLSGQIDKELTEITDFGSNPGDLRMFVYVPAEKESSPRPLVVALHGCSQTAKEIARLSGWNKLADLNDFIVVYPQQRITNNPSNCFNWFLDKDVNKGSGECESIYQMIRQIRSLYKIDSTKLFVTGLSAGAAMTLVMMATHPELFNSGAVFAGGAYKIARDPMAALQISSGKTKLKTAELVQLVREQNPAYKGNYPRLILFQGTKDPVVHPNNAKYIIRQWTGLLNCDTVPCKKESSFAGHDELTRFEYCNKKNKKPSLIYFEGKGIGHQLMVNPGEKENEGGETGLFAVDKDFHATYQTALEFGILKKKK